MISPLVKKIIQALLFFIGITLFIFVIQAVGFERLSVIFQALAGWGWLVFFIYPFMSFWDALGWRVLFDPEWNSKINIRQLYLIRLAGEAVNNITPFIDVAGEFLKVVLVEKRLGVSKKGAAAAGIMSRSALLFAEIIFVVGGLAFASSVPGIPTGLRITLFSGFLICLVCAGLLIRTQKRGLFVSLIAFFERFGVDPNMFNRFHTSLRVVDEEIARFYSHESRRLWLAIGCHLLGWISGGIEVFFMLRILGVEATLFESVILESLIQLMRTASFYIPGNLGVQEGALAFILGIMGVHPSLGVALSLLKRARQVIWTAVGFFIWGIFQLREFTSSNASAKA
ncbi:MAG: flippase-like domain-containing protein [Candidatus Omnitrophica bacterium]|nr:flippase-like domain-containing protein [Candidatus Omnitrophota bacterium]